VPISIADLASGRRQFTLDTEFGPVRISYRPYEMTPAREAAIARLGDSSREDLEDAGEGRDTVDTESGLTKLIAQFCAVVEAWDMVGPLTNRETNEILVEEGEVVPINETIMRHVSNYFMVTVLNGIAADARPKKTRRPD
jgi:hypothetical protein